MSKTIIKNAFVVNEGKVESKDVLIINDRIDKVATSITVDGSIEEIDGSGKYLFPGVIDAQVHFRDPGLTHKADLRTESSAAVAGGVTSFMEMPNTNPATLTQELLEEKYQLASQKSLANYSFFMGVSQDNLEEALKTDKETVCGISDDGLYFNYEEGGILANYPDFLDKLFSSTDHLITLHSEDDDIINENTAKYKAMFGEDIPFNYHHKIRSEEACVVATKRVLEIAKKHNTRFHLLHVSTKAEAEMFDNTLPIRDKRITGEACTHHIYFNESDYDRLGRRIKWNPAIKTENDRSGLIESLKNGKMDVITTDHAPHTWEEKSGNYFQSNSGAPIIQYTLNCLLELHHKGEVDLPFIAEKMAHNVAEVYRIRERGYIREGYYADLVLVDLQGKTVVDQCNILSKCKWSPLEGEVLNSKVTHTWVNGHLAYANGTLNDHQKGKRLLFEKER